MPTKFIGSRTRPTLTTPASKPTSQHTQCRKERHKKILKPSQMRRRPRTSARMMSRTATRYIPSPHLPALPSTKLTMAGHGHGRRRIRMVRPPACSRLPRNKDPATTTPRHRCAAIQPLRTRRPHTIATAPWKHSKSRRERNRSICLPYSIEPHDT